MRVIVTEPIHQIPLEFLRKNVDELVCWDDEAVSDWSMADALIVRAMPITREKIASAPRLKVIGKHGIGVNTIDVAAAKEHGVKVVYAPRSQPYCAAVCNRNVVPRTGWSPQTSKERQ